MEKIFNHIFPQVPMLNCLCWWQPSWMQVMVTRNDFESLPPTDHLYTLFALNCLNCFKKENLNIFSYRTWCYNHVR